MKNSINSKHKGFVKIKFLLTLLILAIACSTFFLLYHYKTLTEQKETAGDYSQTMKQELQELNRQLSLGENKMAIADIDQLLKNVKYESDYYTLLIHKAHALFANADPESYPQAIIILDEILEDTNVAPMFKSWSISELLQFYYNSQSLDVLTNIRQMTFFAPFAKLSDEEFLLESARLSDELYPTPLSKIHQAIPVAKMFAYEQLEYQEEKREKAQEILRLVNESSLLEEENDLFSSTYHKVMFNHYRGLVLSAAVEGGIDPTLAQYEFEHAFSLAKESNDFGVNELILYTLFYYATHIYEFALDPELADESLTTLTNSLEEPSTSSLFRFFAETAHENPNSYNYRQFKIAVSNNEQFSSFIEKNWSLRFE